MSGRDMTPAVGAGGAPAFGEATSEPVALHIGEWRDGRWSYLYGADTAYAAAVAAPHRPPAGPVPDVVQGPIMKPPVWTWEVPLYFWTGGIAAGSSFVALACDLAGDHPSATVARKVVLGALVPSPALLIMDLGRPLRFLNMLRIFKPRSPMSMGVWALTTFGGLAGAAVGADLLGRPQAARATGAATAVVGGYLGSYTGVLLASTAVPVWARSRLLLGPIFVSTAAATGAAACRLVLVASGLPAGHPTRRALGRVETGAMAAELALSIVNERRLGPLADALEHGTPARLFAAAKWCVRAGLLSRAWRDGGRPARVRHAASATFLAAGLMFRYAWVGAGPRSARDDRAVAETARSRRSGE